MEGNRVPQKSEETGKEKLNNAMQKGTMHDTDKSYIVPFNYSPAACC